MTICTPSHGNLNPDKSIHFIGISGVGMSALASWCVQEGWSVQGSTHTPNGLSDALERRGVIVYPDHKASYVHNQLGGVVYSTDISPDHVEIVQARQLNLPLWHRSDFLRAMVKPYHVLAVTGSHGKTTTTSLLGHLMADAGTDPLVVAGGHMNAMNTACRAGKGPWAVVEADESDKSHLNFDTLHTALLTNIGHDHLWRYGHCKNQLKQAFQSYVQLAQQWAVVCHDQVDRDMIVPGTKAAVLWYGLHPSCDFFASDVRFYPEGIQWSCHTPQGLWKDLNLPLYGEHNILNALGCVASAVSCGLNEDQIRRGLASFRGVHRRMTHIGYHHATPLMDDYAQHPTAIATVLKALHHHGYKRVLAICQPHRYYRLRSLFTEYAQAFQHASSVVMVPVYAAGEPVCPEGTTSHHLVEVMRTKGYHSCVHHAQLDQLLPHIQRDSWDMVVFLGAGDITRWARTYRTHDKINPSV